MRGCSSLAALCCVSLLSAQARNDVLPVLLPKAQHVMVGTAGSVLVFGGSPGSVYGWVPGEVSRLQGAASERVGDVFQN